ncbi:MAG: glycosyltransferase [Chitinophagales bacterium]
MRIIHIIPSLRKGGAERLALDISTELASRNGIEVILVLLHNDRNYPVEQSKLQIKHVAANVQLSVLRKPMLNINAWQQLLNEFKPDVVHSHLFEAEIVSRTAHYPKAAWFSHGHDNMPQLETFGLDCFTNKRRLTDFFERQYLLKRYRRNGGNGFIAISKDVQSYLNRVLPADLRNIHLLSNAINASRFYKPADFITKPKAALELVTVGSLVNKKNQTFLVDVVKKLKDDGVDVHLNVLGDGVTRKMLEEKSAAWGLQEQISFRGNVPNVEEYLWNADVYVHSALYEPFGLVLIEAMVAGLPVVSLDGKGNRDIIKEGVNGFMPETDVTQFAQRLMQLHTDKQLYTSISSGAKKFAADYDIKAYCDKLLQIYNTALLH